MAVAAGAVTVMPAQWRSDVCRNKRTGRARGQCAALANGGRRRAKDQVHALRCCHIQLVMVHRSTSSTHRVPTISSRFLYSFIHCRQHILITPAAAAACCNNSNASAGCASCTSTAWCMPYCHATPLGCNTKMGVNICMRRTRRACFFT